MKNIAVSSKFKSLYDDYYEGESEWRYLGALDKVNNIVALCCKYPHRTILDIGSGEGSILQRMSDMRFGESLYSLEISKTAVMTINARKIKSLVECRLFDGYDIPYEDGKFDLAVLSHVLEHLEYPRKMLYEASRVARLVFLEVPLEDNLRLKNDYVYDGVGHINIYSPRTIRRLVHTCDLEIISQQISIPSSKVFQYSMGKKVAPIHLALRMLLRYFPSIATKLYTYHCSIVCRGKDTKDTGGRLTRQLP
jgi:SAM-dependent methyltransferase